MLLHRLYAPARAAFSASKSSQCAGGSGIFDAARSQPGVASPILTFIRHATHQSEGRANGSKDGAGKRLGAKKTAEEYVIPGNIIFRQRGTKWYPGENCGMGRDHTIFSLAHGYVKYYKDPLNHPKRQFIGVVFDRNDKLPYPPAAARKRRLGMVAVKMDPAPGATDSIMRSAIGENEVVSKAKGVEKTRRRSYIIRETNWEIGRAAEKAGIKAKAFVPGDRFRAWRKRTARKARAAEKKTLGGKAKKPVQRRK